MYICYILPTVTSVFDALCESARTLRSCQPVDHYGGGVDPGILMDSPPRTNIVPPVTLAGSNAANAAERPAEDLAFLTLDV